MEFAIHAKGDAPVHRGQPGKEKGGVLPVKEFNRLIERLEDLEDTLASDEAIENAQEFIELQEIRDELRKEGRI